MREEIADGHFVGDVGVVHLEAGEALVNGIVPGDFVGVDEGGESGGGEGFGVGAEPRGCCRRRPRSAELRTRSLWQGWPCVFDDGDRKPGDVEGFQSTSDVGVEVGRRSGLGLNRKRKDRPMITAMNRLLAGALKRKPPRVVEVGLNQPSTIGREKATNPFCA